MSIPNCLRCANVALRSMESTPKIEFFTCPECGRGYARAPGGQLTYRWLHPISIPLHLILFERDPVGRATDIADNFPGRNSHESLDLELSEIEHELDHPTQNVREILDNPHSEDVCREFLRRFCARLRERLAGTPHEG